MENFDLNLNLAKLEGFGKMTLVGKSGQPKVCAVIPIEDNKIFENEKSVILNLRCIASSNSQYGDTHFVVRQKTKEEREWEKEHNEHIKTAILGNMKPIFAKEGFQGAEEYSMPTQPQMQPQTTTQQSQMAQAPRPVQQQQNFMPNTEPDLPF